MDDDYRIFAMIPALQEEEGVPLEQLKTEQAKVAQWRKYINRMEDAPVKRIKKL